jgi:hypothetical protein
MLSEKKIVSIIVLRFFYFRGMWKVKVYNNNPGAEGEEKESNHNILLQYSVYLLMKYYSTMGWFLIK